MYNEERVLEWDAAHSESRFCALKWLPTWCPRWSATSTRFGDLFQLYLRNESVPFLFAADEVTAGTVETLTIEPTE